MEKTVVDVEKLKNKYKEDSLPYHVYSIALDCKQRRDAFWRYSRKLKTRNNWISVPLLVFSSLTGLTSVAQIGSFAMDNNDNQPVTITKDNIGLPIVVTVSGVLTAILSAMQKYFGYAERAELSKHTAKSYGRMARRIENMMMFFESSAISMDPLDFKNFLDEILKDNDIVLQGVNEMPKELVNDAKFYDSILSRFKNRKSNKNIDIDSLSDKNTLEAAKMAVQTCRARDVANNNEITPVESPVNSIQSVDITKQKFDNVIELAQKITELKEKIAAARAEGKLEEIWRLGQIMKDVTPLYNTAYEDYLKCVSGEPEKHYSV